MRVNRVLVAGRPLILGLMSSDQGDVLWEAFVVAMLAIGPAADLHHLGGLLAAAVAANA
jgi:hypothetical protein